MDEIQVYRVDAQNGERLVARAEDLIPAVIGIAQLGGHKDFARHSRGLEGGTDLSLVAVRRGRVDMTVSEGESVLDRLLGLIGPDLERAETYLGNFRTRAKGNRLNAATDHLHGKPPFIEAPTGASHAASPYV